MPTPRFYFVQLLNEKEERYEDIGPWHSTLYSAEQYKAQCEIDHPQSVYAIRPSISTLED